jgi:DNA-binding beta-propeller fold protein YncE
MPIVLRGTKGSALTHAELDGNFTDLDGRVSAAQSGLAGKQNLTPTVTTDSDGTRTLATSDEGDVIDVTNTTSNAIAIDTGFNGLACIITWPASAAAPVLTPTGVTLNGAGSAITGATGPGCLAIFPTGTNAFRVVGSIRQGVPRTLTGAAEPHERHTSTHRLVPRLCASGSRTAQTVKRPSA